MIDLKAIREMLFSVPARETLAAVAREFVCEPVCFWFGHRIERHGRWVSPRVQRARCLRCRRWFAVHITGLSIPEGAATPWTPSIDRFYRERFGWDGRE